MNETELIGHEITYLRPVRRGNGSAIAAVVLVSAFAALVLYELVRTSVTPF